MKISFSKKSRAGTDLYVLAVRPGDAKKTKGRHAKTVRAILSANPEFKGNAGELAIAVVPGSTFKRFGLLGLGAEKEQTPLVLEQTGGKLVGTLITLPISDVFIETDLPAADVANLASGANLRAYEFRIYQTKNKDRHLPRTLTITGDVAAQKAFAPLSKGAEAVHWARDLVNEPANVLFPISFAKRVQEKLTPLGVKVTVRDEKFMEKQGFGAFIAVGKASEHPPRLVILEYKGANAPAGKPLALVGKGITFDTGGYSIKPSDGMLEMKCDMAGAAAVAGAMMTLAATKADVHVVAALALAENMISDEGYKPSDIFTTLSGQTVEITNTDAEGRLVLCDTMWYVQETYKPRALVDIATLTGAALVALGEEYAAVYANEDSVFSALDTASKNTGDKIWRMPLDKAFDKAMDSAIADMRNAAATRYGGSCTAAAFLGRFVQKGVHWAHVDMAPTMNNKPDAALGPRGASGFGVRLLADWVRRA